MAKKTPLYDEHVKAGGKIVDYAGWELPVDYEGLIPEHEAVRERVGMFDVSHMGEIQLLGKDALKFADYVNTNDIKSLEAGKIAYGFFCYEDGGVVDDLLTYKAGDEDIYLVVNAANSDKDYEWLKKQADGFDVEIINVSDQTGEVAVQGPLAEKTLQKLTDFDLSTIEFFTFKRDVEIAGVKAMISRTGYTGEDGFEIYTAWEDIVPVWQKVLEAGEEFGIKPTGLGCRDTLRFEASLPLYGHEISQEVSPLEGGFKYFVKLDKEDFIGKDALVAQNQDPKRKLIGIELVDKGIAREGAKVFKDGKEIGYVTTGYMSPTIGKAIANALVDVEYAKKDIDVEIQVRKRMIKAKTISNRFLTNWKKANNK
ncbi:MAG: glycine cleavage system aminomethyltransferase GcvT [Bacillota bacterium]|nr:glycine cleavage system aminomethyltransferase GcvT [Bacillota bacterium]